MSTVETRRKPSGAPKWSSIHHTCRRERFLECKDTPTSAPLDPFFFSWVVPGVWCITAALLSKDLFKLRTATGSPFFNQSSVELFQRTNTLRNANAMLLKNISSEKLSHVAAVRGLKRLCLALHCVTKRKFLVHLICFSPFLKNF